MTVQTMGYTIDIADDCECEISNDEKTIKVRSKGWTVLNEPPSLPRSGVAQSLPMCG